MNTKKIIAIVLSFAFMIFGLSFMFHSIANADSGYKTWKVYEDGVTYYYENKNDIWSKEKNMGIIVDGKSIQCDNYIFMHGGMIDPQCVEMILRHELDRRGL